MSAKRIFLMLAVGAMLALQVADCTSAMTPDQQSMQCCGSMPCSPTNKLQGCCKTMNSAPALGVVVKARASVNAPPVVAVRYAWKTEFVPRTSIPPATVAVQLDSPVELYTLHATLLI